MGKALPTVHGKHGFSLREPLPRTKAPCWLLLSPSEVWMSVRALDRTSGHGALGPCQPDRTLGSACGQTVRLSISQVAAKRQSASKERVKFWRYSAQVEAPEAPGQPPRGGRAPAGRACSGGCGQRSPGTQGPAHRWRRPPEPRSGPRMHTLLCGEGRPGTATRPGPESHTFEPPSGKGAASRLTDPWPPSPVSAQPEGEALAGRGLLRGWLRAV